jgi:hypothetical protein
VLTTVVGVIFEHHHWCYHEILLLALLLSMVLWVKTHYGGVAFGKKMIFFWVHFVLFWG